MEPNLAETINQGISTIVVTLLGLVTTVLIPYGVALFRSWVKAKIAKIADDKTRADLEQASARLGYITEAVVAAINQSVKVAAADGRIDPDEKRRLKLLALQEIRKQITPYMDEVLRAGFGNLERYMSLKIEQAVLKQKAVECKPPAG